MYIIRRILRKYPSIPYIGMVMAAILANVGVVAIHNSTAVICGVNCVALAVVAAKLKVVSGKLEMSEHRFHTARLRASYDLYPRLVAEARELAAKSLKGDLNARRDMREVVCKIIDLVDAGLINPIRPSDLDGLNNFFSHAILSTIHAQAAKWTGAPDTPKWIQDLIRLSIEDAEQKLAQNDNATRRHTTAN